MYLIVFVGKEREAHGQISALINRFESETIILIGNKSSDFPREGKYEFIEVSSDKDLISLKEELELKLKNLLSSQFEVALSIASGSGKEHMALVSALLAVPVGIKLVAYTKNGIEFLS